MPYYSDLARFLSIRRADKLEGEATRFLYSGSLSERKGVDVLARAFAKLSKGGAKASLTFLGEGPMEVTLRAETAPVMERVQFLGLKDWHELAPIYAQHDILCAPSRYDGWGLVIPEGLASGMPVIASREMGATRDLLHSGTGWSVEAGSEGALLEAMRAAVEQTSDARRVMIAQLVMWRALNT